MRVEKTQTEKDKEKPKPKEPQPFGKLIFLSLLTIVLSVIFWYLLDLIFNVDFKAYQNYWPLVKLFIYVVLAFVVFLGYLSLTIILVESFVVRLLYYILAGLPALLFFNFNIYLIISLIVIVLGMMYFSSMARSELKARIKFSVDKTISHGLHSLIIVFILVVSIIYYGHLFGQKNVDLLLENLGSSVTTLINQILALQIKGYHSDMTLDEFILKTSTQTIEGQVGKMPELGLEEKYLKGLTSQIENKAIEEARQKFLQSFGVEAGGNEAMGLVIKKIVMKKMDQILGPWKKFIPLVIVLSFFFILSIFNYLFRPLVRFFAFIIFKIFYWTKLVKIEKEMVEAERITL